VRVPPRTDSVIETVFREQGVYVGDHDIGRLMISAGLAVMATNNPTANSSLFPGIGSFIPMVHCVAVQTNKILYRP
jgi:hypothetical protein